MKGKILPQRKLWLQALAFGLIVLPPIGLYFTVTLGIVWATWLFMGLVAGGMLLIIAIS